MAYDCRYGLRAKGYLCAKGFCLDGQIHDGGSANCGITVCQSLYCRIVHTAIADSLLHGAAVQLDARMRHHRQCRNLLATDDIGHPLSHILLHELL